MIKTLIIAEIGNNHNGSIARAYELIDAAKASGAHIAKFQLRNMENLYRLNGVEDLGVEYTKDILNKYNLSYNQHKKLADYCASVGLEYMCTPFDQKAVDQLMEFPVSRFKVASADFDNIPLLEKLVETKLPLILSTGMSTTAEIKVVCKFLAKRNVDFTLLHCNSTYPAPFEDIELNFLSSLKLMHDKIGYSGHERGLAVSVAAVALGASVIERHITLDRDLEGPDHNASLLPDEFKSLVKMISEVELAIRPHNIHDRKLSQGTLLNRENLGKSIVAAHDLDSGHIIGYSDLEIRAPGQGLSPSKASSLIGKVLSKKILKHDFFVSSHFEKYSKKLAINNLESNWGVPVRPHDIMLFHNKFNAPVYEFHISYQDLERRNLPKNLKELYGKFFLVHAPELFSNSKLLDLCDKDINERKVSIKNLQDVCDFCSELHLILGMKNKIQIIANVGGFSTHNFRDEREKKLLYQNLSEALNLLVQPHCEIIPQNMAPYPWHFGGQRYQNIFMVPEEILNFCNVNNTNICLDTAHLSMYCEFSKRDFKECFDLLLPVTSHFHMSDAKGLNGEGVKMGTGDVDFEFVLSRINKNQTYIVETWQGHKDSGSGFLEELRYLNGIVL